jgi:hypothetical protein
VAKTQRTARLDDGDDEAGTSEYPLGLFALAHRVAATAGSLTPETAFERLQGLLRVGCDALAAWGVADKEQDAAFYEVFRRAIDAAGATPGEIEHVAAYLVELVVAWTAPHSEDQSYQIDLIARHFARTDMTVRISQSNRVREVTFPARLSRQ